MKKLLLIYNLETFCLRVLCKSPSVVMPLSAASQRSTSPRGFLINNLFMHARARPASQQPAEFTHQPASSRIHACARAASMPPGFMHARAAIQPPGFMHTRARPASSGCHACARAASQRAGFMHARAAIQPPGFMHARARPACHKDSCMRARMPPRRFWIRCGVWYCTWR